MAKIALLGVSGGIAAYKSPILVRQLTQSGWDVHVILTKAAVQFVTPLALATMSENPVQQDMWSHPYEPSMEHISLADMASVLVIAPATANIIGKLASGIADDMLTTMVLATKCPVLICPSMNVNMLHSSVVQRNLATLTDLGYHILDPDSGFLACGWTGEGRLPEPDIIAEAVDSLLTPKDLLGEKILITAGPTEEPIDPVRFLSNRSSGKMGVAIAKRALYRGADVTLVAGPLKTEAPAGVNHISVRTAEEMYEHVIDLARDATVVIKAAAVSDFRPAVTNEEKVKKEDFEPNISLVRNLDILLELGRVKPQGQVLIGFAAETENALQNGRQKLVAKNLDMLVLNDVSLPGAGFDYDTNIVHFLQRSGDEEHIEILPKEQIADLILDRVKILKVRLNSESVEREQAI